MYIQNNLLSQGKQKVFQELKRNSWSGFVLTVWQNLLKSVYENIFWTNEEVNVPVVGFPDVFIMVVDINMYYENEFTWNLNRPNLRTVNSYLF